VRWLTTSMAAVLTISALGTGAAVEAASPRDLLTDAAFAARDKKTALGQINAAKVQADAVLARAAGDREARMAQAMAIGYTARLNRDRGAAVQSRKLFEGLAASAPADPEAQAAVAGWHLDTIDTLGNFMARTVMGANRTAGLAAIDRAAKLGADQAMFPALAAMMRIRLDPADVATARRYAEAAVAAPAPTRIDQIMKRGATQLLTPLRAGDGKAAAALARQLLPFGRIGS
jgi:hypothetical protein